jgi:outer membrane protein assembly factor BamB
MVSNQTPLPETFDPGLCGDGVREPNLPASANVKWTAKLGPRTYGSPVVAGGRVLIGSTTAGLAHVVGPAPKGVGKSGGLILCLDEATGKLLWELPLAKLSSRKSPHGDTGYGVCSTTTIENGRAYIVSNRGEVLCMDMEGMANGNDGPYVDEAALLGGLDDGGKPLPRTDLPARCGDVLWCYDMVSELKVRPHDGSSSSVLIHGDYLYVGTGNGRNERENLVPSPQAPSLIVLNKRTGRLVAQDDEKIGTRLWKSQWSSPSLSVADGRERIIYGAGDGCCYAFDSIAREDSQRVLSLRKLWSIDCNHSEYRDGNFVLPERPTRMPAPSEIIGTPVCHDGRVYVTVGRDPAHPLAKGCLTCLDAATGRRLWAYEDIGMCLAAPTVADGLLYIGEILGVIHCLDVETGRPRWTRKIKGEVWGAALIADGKVYVPTSDGLLVFAAGSEGSLLSAVRLDGAVYTAPCAANGVLFVASVRHLYAVCPRR